MLTHLIKTINWVDVALAILLIRMIFVGVKNGFISEFFKLLAVVVAAFICLHYYSYLAAWTAQKTHHHWDFWELTFFALLWIGVWLFFKLVREGVLLLFKAETTHEGFDKYAAGVVAIGRGILVCSLTIFLILLMHCSFLARMTLRSYSFKIAGHASVSTYSFLYNNLVSKLFTREHYNAAAPKVLRPEGK